MFAPSPANAARAAHILRQPERLRLNLRRLKMSTAEEYADAIQEATRGCNAALTDLKSASRAFRRWRRRLNAVEDARDAGLPIPAHQPASD